MIEPKKYRHAVSNSNWRGAMGSEIIALEVNHTRDLVDLPLGNKVLGCKWVYKIKHKSDGSIERYKARLVVLKNHQVEGENCEETFAPVAKMDSV